MFISDARPALNLLAYTCIIKKGWMKENNPKEVTEEYGLAQYLEALDLEPRSREASPPKNRAGSAPPTFDSSSLFLYMEDDVYTRSFTNSFLNTRKDNLYGEFYEQYKHKNPNMPPPLSQDDLAPGRDPKNPHGNVIETQIIPGVVIRHPQAFRGF